HPGAIHMSVARSTNDRALIQNGFSRPVLLGSLSISSSAANFSLPAWSTELISLDGKTSSQIDVAPGALLWLSSTVQCNVRLTAAGSGKASGTVTYSSSSGAQTIVLGGRTVSFTAGASDTLTAQEAVKALDNDPLISLAFNVSSSAGVVTIKRLVGGSGGNVTLVATGTGSS